MRMILNIYVYNKFFVFRLIFFSLFVSVFVFGIRFSSRYSLKSHSIGFSLLTSSKDTKNNQTERKEKTILLFRNIAICASFVFLVVFCCHCSASSTHNLWIEHMNQFIRNSRNGHPITAFAKYRLKIQTIIILSNGNIKNSKANVEKIKQIKIWTYRESIKNGCRLFFSLTLR